MRYKSYVASYAGNSEKINRYNCFMNGILKEDALAPTFYAGNRDFKRRNLYGIVGAQNNYDTGEELAYIIANLMGDFLGEEFDKEYKNFFEYSNSAILSHLFEMPEDARSVDLSMLYIKDDKAMVFNIGKAPVYFFKNGKLKKVSGKVPETVEIKKKSLNEKGEMVTEVVVKKNIPYLGFFDEDYVTEPYKSEKIRLRKKGFFLLCNSAVVDVLGEDKITQILSDRRIEDRDKSLQIVEEALKIEPEGDFLAEIVRVKRGPAIGSSDMRNLLHWIIIAMLCGVLWLTGPFVAERVSNWVDGIKESVETYLDEHRKEEDQRVWVPKEKPEEKKPEQKNPDETENEENSSEVQKSGTQSGVTGTGTVQRPNPVQNETPVQVQKPEPEPEPSGTEVELPIDFN